MLYIYTENHKHVYCLAFLFTQLNNLMVYILYSVRQQFVKINQRLLFFIYLFLHKHFIILSYISYIVIFYGLRGDFIIILYCCIEIA